MSIFGPKDRDVNLLTQFYQLEFDPEQPMGSELDQWMFRLQYGLQLPEPLQQNSHEQPGGHWMYSQMGSPISGMGQRRRNAVIHVAELYPMVRRLMDYYADYEAVTRVDPAGETYFVQPESLRNDAAELSQRLRALRPCVGLPNHYNEYFDHEHPIQIYYGDTEGMAALDTAILSGLVGALQKGRSAFRRCPTCGSVFIANVKQDQKYCSNRCSARMRTRRTRENKNKETLAFV